MPASSLPPFAWISSLVAAVFCCLITAFNCLMSAEHSVIGSLKHRW